MYYIGVRDGMKEKECKMNLSGFVFCPTVYLAGLIVYKIWRLALIEDGKFEAENLLVEKEK